MFIKSIRWRMQVWQAFLLVAILSGFGVTAYELHRGNRFSQIDEELQERVAALSSDARHSAPPGKPPGPPPFPPKVEGPFPRRRGPDGRPPRGGPGDFLASREIRLSTQTLSLFEPVETNGFYYAVWARSGALLLRSTNAPAELSLPGGLEADTGIHTQTHADYREAFHFTELGECILAGRLITADLEAMRRFAWLLGIAGVAVLALGMGGGWILANQALRPVEEISAAASRISAGNLSERINVAERENELGRLAAVLNSTFARLEAAFLHQKQFTADASHELRTPMAVLISEIQTALTRERSAPEYRETLEACLTAAQQMRRLMQSLLELARFDAGQEPLDEESFDLEAKARECLDLVRPLAAEHRVRLHADLAPVAVTGDPDRLGQVITNLLTNAIYYNRQAGEVRLTLRQDDGAAILTVADTGLGIPPEDLPRVFERFYRADKARARAQGRTGLGLAICKAIVDAHHGQIEVSSQASQGSTFTVHIPTRQPSAEPIKPA